MRRNMFMILAACATLFAQGAWYWPFGSSEDDPSKPLRLHRLLEEANNYIEIAEDEALNGKADAALENYRLALSELDRVERENPDRAETAEFSPLRNKRAACIAAMDAIRFAQVDENERAVSVTDTRALQKKWNKKHGIKDPEEKQDAATAKDSKDLKDRDAKANTDSKEPKDGKAAPEQPATNTPPKPEEPPAPASEASAPKPPEPKPPEAKAPESKPSETKPAESKTPAPAAERPASSDFKFRLKTALAEVRNKDYVAADLLLEELMREKPGDLNILLLRAAAQAGMESNYAARRTLEKAMRTHPKSYLPYYNLANLVLQMGEGVETARQYYEMGRMVGGPPSAALEKLLKEKK